MSKLLRKIVDAAHKGEIVENRISLPISLIATDKDRTDFNKVAGAFAEFIIADKYGFEMVGSGGSFPDLKAKDGNLWIEMKLGKNPPFIRSLGKKKTAYEVYLDKQNKWQKITKKGADLWLMWVDWKPQLDRPNEEDKIDAPEVPSWFYIAINQIRFINLKVIFEKDIWKTEINLQQFTTGDLFKRFGGKEYE